MVGKIVFCEFDGDGGLGMEAWVHVVKHIFMYGDGKILTIFMYM